MGKYPWGQASDGHNDDLRLRTAPGAKWVAFDSDERDEDRSRSGPRDIAFVSTDGGSTWTFDPKTKVSSWTEFHGQVSDTDAFTVGGGALSTERSEEERVWVTRDRSRSWQSIDLREAVWPDQQEKENEVLNASWAVLPDPAGNAVGWSSLEAIAIDDQGYAKSTRFVESRRFELDFGGEQVAVRNVSAAPDWGKKSVSSYEIVRNASGQALLGYRGGLYHLDPTARQWSKVATPDIHGVSSNVYHNGVWLGNDIWIIEASGQTAWNVVACYMPPYFRKTRNCGLSSAHAYFYSKDQGRSWMPFTLPTSPDDFSTPKILGWDNQRQGLLVTRSDPNRPGDKVELYRLPPQ